MEDEADTARRRQAERLALLADLARPVQHDINNLLTVVFANLDMLKRRVEGEAPQRQLDRVAEATRRLEASTRAILSLARRPVPGEAVLRPGDALAALRPLLALVLPAPGALLLDTAPETPPCRFDQALLDEALLGLALAAAGRGPLRLALAPTEEGVALEAALPGPARAAAEPAVDALRTLATRAGGSLATDATPTEATLRLCLPRDPATIGG